MPFPMHIAIAETPAAGPGDCHVKGGYIEGEPTFTVKVATVSFVKNLEKVCQQPVCHALSFGRLLAEKFQLPANTVAHTEIEHTREWRRVVVYFSCLTHPLGR